MLPLHQALALFAAATLVACGGSLSSAPAPDALSVPDAPAGPPPPTVLEASTGALGLAVSGKARHIVIHNRGEHPALDLVVTGREALPAGTRLDTDCGTLAPGADCALTFTPGATPSATPGDGNPQPVVLSLAGSNTNGLALTVQLLGFGSLYQGGYVFDIDDGTPDGASIGGKAAAPGLLGPAPSGYSADDDTGATDPFDGQGNTRKLLAWHGTPAPGAVPYAAWVCATSDAAGHHDWYLPAACELGYDQLDRFQDCGLPHQLVMPNNLQSRLFDTRIVSRWTGSDANWLELYIPSSTHLDATRSGFGLHDVRAQYHERFAQPPMPPEQGQSPQYISDPVQCVRRLSP